MFCRRENCPKIKIKSIQPGNEEIARSVADSIYSQNTQRVPIIIYMGMTFINRERIALLESKFQFQIEYCNVTTVALFQIRNADWFIIDMRRMFTCK